MSLQKKLEQAYIQGFNDACDIWERVADQTPGVGPILKQRMIEMVRKMAEDMRKKRGVEHVENPKNTPLSRKQMVDGRLDN